MKALCGIDCSNCPMYKKCGGCNKCKGHPFGGNCIAERLINKNGKVYFEEYKSKLIKQINDLGIKKLHVESLNLLMGSYVNLEYKLENGNKVKFLKDSDIYLGCQIETGTNRCFGVVANEKFILVCTYGCNGTNPKLVTYIKR